VSGAAAAARCSTETATLALGERIGTRVEPGDLILLSGELGAGKTLLVRGIATGMGIDPALVRSPTFVLHHVYRAGAKVLHHLDLYRLGPSADIRLLDIDEMLESGGVVVVEWGDHAARDQRAIAGISISIDIDDDGSRRITLLPGAPRRISDAWNEGRRA
jgi:tRNA threonylcarbamoyladenosine biosynthesis protein TsaE